MFYEASGWDSETLDYRRDAHGNMEPELLRTKVTYRKPVNKVRSALLKAISEIDEPLHNILTELYLAYDNHAYILAVIGLRAALDRAMELLDSGSGRGFKDKLLALKGRWIGDIELGILEVTIKAGDASAHRAWSLDAQGTTLLIETTETFLHRAIIANPKVKMIGENIPPRPPKLGPKTAD